MAEAVATKTGTALARVEETAAETPGKLTVSQRKAFLEVASRTDLDRIAPEQQRGALIAFGQHTGLRPELGEVMIYQGRFYVTMLGRVRNAHRLGLFDGIRAHPASLHDRRNAGYEETDIVWVTEVWRRGSSRAFRGWGKVTRAELETARAGEKSKFTPVAKHPVEMARKRSEYDALRLAFPLDEELSEISARLIEAAEAQAEVHDAEEELEAGQEADEEAGSPEMTEEESLALDAQAALE